MNDRVLAIDPGSTKTGWVVFDSGDMRLVEFDISENGEFRRKLRGQWFFNRAIDHVVIEAVASFGMRVGKTIFDTVFWSGRFMEAVSVHIPYFFSLYRKQVVVELCGTPKAGDADVRRAIMDMYPRTGGGAHPQIGVKNNQGPLYGMKKDCWAALAVAISFKDIYLVRGDNETVLKRSL